ncbi:hypothetical protein COV19_00805 [Candidatus Woesearchaeota archaeon CG10_big_fil_rev_8_21_14_0_10_44_13]|nr:MAG: hypothetical protein COV19_00805 [Candidatus Woesearchaeota archaeon CG10_big_fil_rev_8_21_14_0_10_44_13]
MALEQYQIYLLLLVDLFAVLTAAFATLTVIRIWRKKSQENVKDFLINVFIMLAAGYILYAIAELSWNIIGQRTGQTTFVGFPDYFWIAGVVMVFSGFLYFSYKMYQRHGSLQKGISIMSIATAFSYLIIYYLISNFILGAQAGETSFEIFLDYFYPISSAAIFIISLSTYAFFRRLETLGRPLLFLVLYNASSFCGDMLYTYYSWNDIYGMPGLLSDGFYTLSYILSFVAFLMISRALSTKVKDKA